MRESKAPLTGFVKTNKGLAWALVNDATNKTASEIQEMGEMDRYLTASLRAEFYRQKYKD